MQDYPGVQVRANVDVSDLAFGDDIVLLSYSYKEMLSACTFMHRTPGCRQYSSLVNRAKPMKKNWAKAFSGSTQDLRVWSASIENMVDLLIIGDADSTSPVGRTPQVQVMVKLISAESY